MKPIISVIGTTHNNPDKLLQMVCNFKLQTRQDFIFHIIHDGYNEEVRNFIKPFLTSNMIWHEMEGLNGPGNYKGRNMILDQIATPWFMNASDDNYFVPQTMELIIPILETQEIDFLMFKCVHNYFEYVYERFSDNMPLPGAIDLCQFVAKTDMVLNVGKFDINKEMKHNLDGELCETLVNTYPDIKIGVMANCLLVHN